MKSMQTDPLQQTEIIAKEASDYIRKRGKGVFNRYPLLFSFLGTFGVVLIIHGFDGMIEKIAVLNNRPLLLLLTGIIILILTGTLYKRIDKKLD